MNSPGRQADYSSRRFWLAVACTLALVLLLLTGGACWDAWIMTQADQSAHSDYLKLKTALFNAVSAQPSQPRLAAINLKGPAPYPPFLRSPEAPPEIKAELGPGITAHIFHQLRRRRRQRPITVTYLEVYHHQGLRLYQYSEVNGRVLEMVIKRPERPSANPFSQLWSSISG